MAQDSPYSANFKMFSGDGVETQFTVRAEDAHQHIQNVISYKAQLQANGFSAQPGKGSAGGRTIQADGIVKGYFTPKEGGEGECYWVYGQNGKFRNATIYPEQWAKVPLAIKKLVDSAQTRRSDSAPEREKAILAKTYIKLPPGISINMEQRTDYDGNPLLSDNGKPMWKFNGFVSDGSVQVVSAVSGNVGSDVPF